MRKVKIKKLPNFKGGGSSNPKSHGLQTPPQDAASNPGMGNYHGGNTPEIKINRTLKPVPREEANLEAELGETVVTNLQNEGIPEFYKIGGKRHYNGGTPLNLPESSFIFSRDNKMKISDPAALNVFGKSGKKAYTPAELSKQYDLNKYREILANPFSDKMQIETAEMMIQNYNLKLGALALAQESTKGFDGGIPAISMGYLQELGIDPSSLAGMEEQQGQMQPPQMPTGKYGMEMFKGGGQKRLKKYQTEGQVTYDGTGRVPGSYQSGEAPYTYDQRFQKAGYDRLNHLFKGYGLDPLDESIIGNEDMFMPAVNRLHKYEIENRPNMVIETMLRDPNNKLYNTLATLKDPDGNSYERSKEGVAKAKADGMLTNDQLLDSYDDQQWYYRGMETAVQDMSREEYDKFMAEHEGEFMTGKDGHQYLYDEENKRYLRYQPYERRIEKTPDPDPVVNTDKKLQEYKQNIPFLMSNPDRADIGLAAYDLLSLKKYDPMRPANIDYRENVDFADYKQARANVNSQVAGIARNAAAMGNPQAYAATMGAIQGNAMSNLGELQAQEFNTNVGISNARNARVAQGKMAADQANAASAKQYFDETNIANQQFDNSKRALRRNLADAYRQGFDNRANLYATNMMSDNYHYDPRTHQFKFRPGYTPKAEKTPTMASTYDELKQGRSQEEALAIFKAMYGNSKKSQ